MLRDVTRWPSEDWNHRYSAPFQAVHDEVRREWVKLELTPDEVKALAVMAENELMRMRFVKPEVPGARPRHPHAGKAGEL